MFVSKSLGRSFTWSHSRRSSSLRKTTSDHIEISYSRHTSTACPKTLAQIKQRILMSLSASFAILQGEGVISDRLLAQPLEHCNGKGKTELKSQTTAETTECQNLEFNTNREVSDG